MTVSDDMYGAHNFSRARSDLRGKGLGNDPFYSDYLTDLSEIYFYFFRYYLLLNGCVLSGTFAILFALQSVVGQYQGFVK